MTILDIKKKLLLKKIECISTQAINEFYLEIYLDGIKQPVLEIVLSIGRSQILDLSYNFTNKVEVRLFDPNSQSNDNLLETIRLPIQPNLKALTVECSEGSSVYQLFYSIELLSFGLGGVNEDPTPGPTPKPPSGR